MASTYKGLAIALAALAGIVGGGSSMAAPVYFTFDLHGGLLSGLPTPFISFVDGPADSNGDGWFETVLKINLRDPSQSNPYSFAQFRISYDGAPTGVSVNIGDSRSNNGGSGDGGTQSNDAELQLGALVGDPANYDRLMAFGNDYAPAAQRTLTDVHGFAQPPHDVFLTVGNRYAGWNNGNGVSGSVMSDYLFALDGQVDTEGPVNYDVYAAFNRVIDGNYRIGAGVGQVTVCLSADASCFEVPAPASLPLVLLALCSTAALRRRQARAA